MNVLSLFDGISSGIQALKNIGISCNYFASEIDSYALQVSKKNHPEIIQLGDVKDIQTCNLPKIDLLLAGSPCTNLSVAGKNNGLVGKSVLYFEFLRLLKELQPRYFLLENVKMKKEYSDIISKDLNINYIEINSSNFSAQNRKRYYWTNIQNVKNSNNCKCLDVVFDILDSNIDKKYIVIPKREVIYKNPNAHKIGYISKDSQGNRIYNPNFKGITLCASSGGLGAKTGLYLINNAIRKLTPIECEKLQTLPINYTDGISDNQQYKCLGNGWTITVIEHILKGLKDEIT